MRYIPTCLCMILGSINASPSCDGKIPSLNTIKSEIISISQGRTFTMCPSSSHLLRHYWRFQDRKIGLSDVFTLRGVRCHRWFWRFVSPLTFQSRREGFAFSALVAGSSGLTLVGTA
ncbi:hypothetical protein F4819DRAFT_91079 [Hypoxylon fuscum]|nr:hypothetical protein F4819DRAFT_91079 [Hypoxylon fuscum]